MSLWLMKCRCIFMVGRTKKIADHLTLDEIRELMDEYKKSDIDMYTKLLLINIVSQGESIARASKLVNKSRKTGERWVNNYNEKGLEGLQTKYQNCGRKSKLTEKQLAELKEIISSDEDSYSVEDVQKLIKERYGIDYSYKTVWRIVRKKLGLN